LFGNDNIHNEAHFVESNIPNFFTGEFVFSVDKYELPQRRGNGFWTGRGVEPENIKHKFRFSPKLPSICINQKCSKGIGSLHIL